MRGAILVVALGASGCDRVFDLSPAPVEPDATTEVDAAPMRYCRGHGLAATCIAEAPSQDSFDLAGRFSTDSDPCVEGMTGDARVCVIAAGRITVGAVQISGSRPLVLMATSTIEVRDLVDASATADRGGPGAPQGCGENDGKSGSTSGGGGPGGSSKFSGGRGGGGGGDKLTRTDPPPQVAPTRLVGGCPGGAGGSASGGQPASGGGRGGGGGAIAFVAGMSINVQQMAVINAAGGGGGGGAMGVSGGGGGGGGGGGAGGMILFDAPTVSILGDVFARSGGGGGGGSTMSSGEPGAEPKSRGDQPTGGDAGMPGGARGGAPCGTDDGMQGGVPVPPVAAHGGGGGGGSCGYIAVYGEIAGGSVPTNPRVDGK